MYNIQKLVSRIIFSLCLLVYGIGKAEAASFNFTKVIDNNTRIEGTLLNNNPNPYNNPVFAGIALSNGNVAFLNINQSLGNAIYTWINGSIALVADRNTPLGDSTEKFFDIGIPTFDGVHVAFKAFRGTPLSNNGIYRFDTEGIYTNLGGSLSVVADRNTPIFSSTNNLFSFGVAPTLDNNVVAFTTYGDNESGVYKKENGLLSVIANRSTVIPGTTTNFTSFDNPVVNNGDIVFPAFGYLQGNYPLDISFRPGIYLASNNSLNVIADRNTPIPGGIGNFDFLYPPNLDNKAVVFGGSKTTEGEFQQGIYLQNNGSLSLIADLNTPIPDGAGKFYSLNGAAPATDNGNVAFIGYGSYSHVGIYTTLGGSLSKVIDNNDTLDGKTIRPLRDSLSLGREGLSGNQLAFLAQFTDGSQGIYIATLDLTSIPESSTVLSIFSIAALCIALKRTRCA